MYQWVDPATKITQFSGKPPVWYRSKEGGPRVIVFENDRVIDDTNINVSDVEQERLRHQAFLRAEADREIAREKLLQAKRLEAISKMEEGTQGSAELAQPASPEPAEKGADEAPAVKTQAPSSPATDEVVVNQMRKLIKDWEQKRAASAKAMIEP